MHVYPNSRIVLLRLRLGGVKGESGGLQEVKEEEMTFTNCCSIVSRILSSHRSSRQYRQLVRADVVHDAAEPLLLPDADGVPGMLGVYQRPNACFFFNPYCWLLRWLWLGFCKLNDSMRPVQPVWYCRHPGSRGLECIRWWIGWEKEAFNVSSHPPSLPHSSCVTLMSHMRWAALAALNPKLKVAVSPALAPMSTYTASWVFSK